MKIKSFLNTKLRSAKKRKEIFIKIKHLPHINSLYARNKKSLLKNENLKITIQRIYIELRCISYTNFIIFTFLIEKSFWLIKKFKL